MSHGRAGGGLIHVALADPGGADGVDAGASRALLKCGRGAALSGRGAAIVLRGRGAGRERPLGDLQGKGVASPWLGRLDGGRVTLDSPHGIAVAAAR